MLGLRKRANYKRFHYEPRYYDPQTEELKERVQLKRMQEGKPVDESSEYKQRISRFYKQNYNPKSTSLDSGRLIRLAVIAGVLVGILFWYDIPTAIINLIAK